MCLENFTLHFSSPQDPRQSAKVAYPLFDILFASLCAMIAGAEGWSDIQEYTEGQIKYKKETHASLDENAISGTSITSGIC